MTETEIQNILEKQHKFFQTGQTLPVNYRIEQLKKLKDSIIRHIRNMNLSMNIPETLDGIRNEDIPKLARYADKEANPLYPVPVLWGPSKLEQMYHLVQEVNENDRSRNSEHPGKAA